MNSAVKRAGASLRSFLVSRLRELYFMRGISYGLWWVIREHFLRTGKGLRFTELHEMHRAVAGVRSKAATAKALSRLLRYGLVRKAESGYVPLVFDDAVVSGAIDFRRVRTRAQVLMKRRGVRKRLPRVVRKVIDVAWSLLFTGERVTALDFLAHTLLPLRKTGMLVAWVGDLFLYFEKKTGKMHLLRSERLAKLFAEMGFTEGLLLGYRGGTAEGLIRDLFGGYTNARRVHYVLKELGWFQYPSVRWFYRFVKDPAVGELTLIIYEVRDDGSEVEVFRVPKNGASRGKVVVAGPVVVGEHVKEENEGTYFVRPRGWF